MRDALDLAWQSLADAECAHDVEQARHAVDELHSLTPEQRDNGWLLSSSSSG